jgi:hypothetical protein
LPLASEPLIRTTDSALLQPSSYLLFVMLRLKPSQSLQSATALARSLESEIVPANAPQFVRPLRSHRLPRARRVLLEAPAGFDNDSASPSSSSWRWSRSCC